MSTKLNKEEKEILSSFEKGEWKSIPDLKNEMERHVEYAKATYRKDKRVNIRMSQKDLDAIHRKALEEGIPYQTLISSILHKFLSGKLVEKDNIIIIK